MGTNACYGLTVINRRNNYIGISRCTYSFYGISDNYVVFLYFFIFKADVSFSLLPSPLSLVLVVSVEVPPTVLSDGLMSQPVRAKIQAMAQSRDVKSSQFFTHKNLRNIDLFPVVKVYFFKV
ncbi:MAG: hypothetical protein ACI3XS_03925, partial [Eubacteriales bacterium]